LQYQGGLADTRFAAYQYERALHQPAAQHTVQLRVMQVDAGFVIGGNLV
jgi:hypothetical protein